MTLNERQACSPGCEVILIEDDSVAAVETAFGYCKKKGHSAEECGKNKRDAESKNKSGIKGSQWNKKDDEEKREKMWALFVSEEVNELSDAVTDNYDFKYDEDEAPKGTIKWILDSGCGRHLAGSPNLHLKNFVEAETPIQHPDGSTVGSIKREVSGATNIVDVYDVELVHGLKKKILSYVRHEHKGVRLIYEGKKRYLAEST